MSDFDYEPAALAAARRMLAEKPTPDTVVVIMQLREKYALGLHQVRRIVGQAAAELFRTYYAVCSGAPLIEGPFRGLEMAAQEASLGFTPIAVPLPADQETLQAVVDGFVRQLSNEKDIELVVRLTYLYLEQFNLDAMPPRLKALRGNERARHQFVQDTYAAQQCRSGE
jgi:hypothetical protein